MADQTRPSGIDVTGMTTPALNAALQERKSQAETIIDGYKAKAANGENPLHLLSAEDRTRVKGLHGDAQILNQEILRRAENDNMLADFERIGKAATTIAGMPQPEGPAGSDYGPLTPGQAFVMSKSYQDARAAGTFKVSIQDAGGAYPQISVPLTYKTSFPVHRRLLREAAKNHPEFFTKATALNTGASSGGGFILPEFDLTPEMVARESLDVVGLLRIQPTDSNLIEWLRQDTALAAADTVPEYTDAADVTTGKPQGEETYSIQQMAVKTIAGSIAITNQQLDDAPECRAVIDDDLRFDVAKKLNSQVLTGGGTGNNFTGILTVLTNESIADIAFNPATPTHDNILDALLDAWVTIRVANEDGVTGTLLHWRDWERCRTLKTDGTGEYMMGPPGAMGAAVLWDIPLVGTTNITEGTGLVGNYQVARLHIRQEAVVKLGWAHNDFLANRVRLLGEMRGCLTVRRPNAFRRVTGLNS